MAKKNKDSEELRKENMSEEAPIESAEETAPQTDETSGTDEASAELEKLNGEIASLKESQLRLMAEYDNYKKRTAREKEALLFDATLLCMNKFLPVLDNLIRATETPCSDEAYKGGVDMVFKSFIEAMDRMGVKKIEALNAPFDPNLHNAVMHIDSEEYPENTVVEVFQEGYIMGDRVIRHAMVKVAN